MKIVKILLIALVGVGGAAATGFYLFFAENEEDLYFAQGYIIARERMFQMAWKPPTPCPGSIFS